MINCAIVRENLDNGLALVEINRSSSCGDSCASCGLCARNSKQELFKVKNPIEAVPGEQVVIEQPAGKALTLTAVVFVLPVVLLAAGLYFGLVTGILGLGIGLGAAVAADRVTAKRGDVFAVITKRM